MSNLSNDLISASALEPTAALTADTSASAINDITKAKILNLVKWYYDIQKLRIATGNRLVASFRPDLVTPSSDFEDLDSDAVVEDVGNAQALDDEAAKQKKSRDSMIAKLHKDYKCITDFYASEFNSKGRISKSIERLGPELAYIKTETDFEIVSTYESLRQVESVALKPVERFVKTHPLWDSFFEGVKGCGPLMAACCIAYFDPYKARHCSSFWKYAGLDVVLKTNPETFEIEGEGRSKKHTQMVSYIKKDGTEGEKRGITFNPELKCKLVGVLGSCFLKSPGSHYEQIYRGYRNRLENMPEHKSKTPRHRHMMANRYMVKMFVRDLWVAWRTLEGLEVSKPYEVAMLGRNPHGYNSAGL